MAYGPQAKSPVCVQGFQAQENPTIPFRLLSVCTHHTLPSSWRVSSGVTYSAGFNVVIPSPLPLSFPLSACHHSFSGSQSSTLSLEGPSAVSSSSQGSWRAPSP